MYNGHCINPYPSFFFLFSFLKTKSAFKVFTHVQLSGSTLQSKAWTTIQMFQIKPSCLLCFLEGIYAAVPWF